MDGKVVCFRLCATKVLVDSVGSKGRVAPMRFQTQWLRRVVGVFTLTTTLFSIPATNTFAQASLFDPAFKVGHGANGIVYSIVVQDDGKIVVGGEFTQIAGSVRTNLARLNSDGQLDTSFPQGTDGAVYRLLKQPDGKVLVGGVFTNLQGVARQRVGRLLTNGLVDINFDPGVAIAPDFGVSALAFQSDGKILAATLPLALPYMSALKRLEADGQLDASFTQTNVFQDWHVFTICPLTNGSILVGGGFQRVNDLSRTGLALLNTNGLLRLDFDSPFTSDTNLLHYSGVYSLIGLPDSSVLLGGKFWQRDSTNRYAVAKLTSNLALDASFHADPFDGSIEHPNFGVVMSAIQQSDGKYILGGRFQEVGGYWRNIVRLNSEGRVDPCFDPGISLIGPPDRAMGVMALAEQTGGRILAGGDFVCFSGSPIQSLSSSNLTRLLPQTDCGVTRVHLGREAGVYFVAGTCAPGGTNSLQASTNLVDWFALESGPMTTTTFPYVVWHLPSMFTNESSLFFRVKKEY